MKNELIVHPHDPNWNQARLAWNLSADQQPAAVALPESAEDVVAMVRWARERGLRIAPQGTGHNAVPLGSLAHTVLMKTERMRGVEIDPKAGIARVEAGVLWEQVTEAAAEHGLAALAGSSPDVGVVGYSLGGGISWLGRKHGLAANAITAVELVNAEGELIRADAENHTDLFWAIRGGGGSFGVVTALELRLFPISQVYAGVLFFPLERGTEVLRAWREWVDEVPEEVTSVGRFLRFPPIPHILEPLRGNSFVVVEATSLLSEAESAELLRPLRMDPPQPVPGAGDGMLLADFDEAAIDEMVRVGGAGVPSPLISIEVRHLGGALGRRAPGAGALASIEGQFAMFAVGMTPTPELESAVKANVEIVLAALAPWVSGRMYLNFAEKRRRGEELFGDLTYRRLQTVKAAVDPEVVFRSNYPVRLPSTEARKAA